jgi:hypothetical protein
MSSVPVVPRSVVTFGIEPSLRPRLPSLVGDGVIVIDYFATRRCGPAVGDLVVRVREAPPVPGYVALAPLEGVPIVARRDLLPLLARAGPALRLAGPPFARHLAISLDLPELWIDFLDGPTCRT